MPSSGARFILAISSGEGSEIANPKWLERSAYVWSRKPSRPFISQWWNVQYLILNLRHFSTGVWTPQRRQFGHS
ncbi:MAG: hypothetical protein JRN06_04770 [Nitrososphaerota archaeon]|nr:hypothetical protein [Nitrososphaerota archaeon]MDG7023931.1 hypothetical protein [Nitrososphaerota archaeon]